MAETPATFKMLIVEGIRKYNITAQVKDDTYVAIEVDGVRITDKTVYDLVDNYVVFRKDYPLPVGKELAILVAQSEEALQNFGTLSSVEIVAQNMESVLTTGSNIQQVNLVSAHIPEVNNVSDNMIAVLKSLDNARVASEEAYKASLHEDACEQAKQRVLDVETYLKNRLDNFDTIYLGAKATPPTLDNNGDPLISGALYFNTVDDRLNIFNGTSWIALSVTLATKQEVFEGILNSKAVTPEGLDAVPERFRANKDEVVAGIENRKFITPDALNKAGGIGTRLIFIRNSTNTGYTTLMPYNISQHSIFGLYFDDIGQSKSLNSTIDWLFKPKADLNGQLLQLMDADIDVFLKGDLRVINEVGVADPILMKSFKDLALMVKGNVSVGDIIFTSPVTDGEKKDITIIKQTILDFTGIDFTGKLLHMSVGYAYFYGSQPSNVRKLWEYGMPIAFYDKFLIGGTESQGDVEGGLLHITQTTTELVANVLRGGTYSERWHTYIHAELRNISIQLSKE